MVVVPGRRGDYTPARAKLLLLLLLLPLPRMLPQPARRPGALTPPPVSAGDHGGLRRTLTATTPSRTPSRRCQPAFQTAACGRGPALRWATEGYAYRSWKLVVESPDIFPNLGGPAAGRCQWFPGRTFRAGSPNKASTST